MKKKILLILLSVALLFGILYLQFGREPIINHALTETTSVDCDLSMTITANKLFILNREKSANSLMERILNNEFQNMQLSYDVHGCPNNVTITVYTNKLAKFLELPSFQFHYCTDSHSGEFIFSKQ